MKITSMSVRTPALRIALSLSAAVLLAACGKSAGNAKPVAVTPPPDPMVVKVSPQMASNFQVAPLQYTELSTVQEVAGRIEANHRLLTRIGASVSGRMTEVLVEPGDTVKAGQTLARVASPELTQAQLAVLRASSAARLAERAAERAQQLLAADVIGAAEAQRRESDRDVARAELRASVDQLQLLGLSARDVRALQSEGRLSHAASITATRSGVVVERNVSQGQVAQPGDALFTVADLSNVWVVGNLPELAATTVAVGQTVQIEVPALAGEPLLGKIVSVGATVQPDTRTVEIRTQVDNAGLLLKPQMLATMRISGTPHRVLAVPVAAVVRQGDRDHLYVKAGENQYRLTPVELGAPSGDLRPVRGGATEGTVVVTTGAFHLNNERNRAELE